MYGATEPVTLRPHSNLLPHSLPYHDLQRLLFEWFFFRYDCFSKGLQSTILGDYLLMVFDFQGLGYATNLLYFLQAVSRAFHGVMGSSWACFFFGWRLFDDMNSWTMRPGSMALGIRSLSAAFLRRQLQGAQEILLICCSHELPETNIYLPRRPSP